MTENTFNYHFNLPKHADIYHISLDISKNNLEFILKDILINTYQIDVFGYNNTEDYYWCKIKNRFKIISYVEIKIIYNYDNNTNIFFIAKTHNLFRHQRQIVNKIVKNFVEIFERYNISRVVSIKINAKIKIKKANFFFVYG